VLCSTTPARLVLGAAITAVTALSGALEAQTVRDGAFARSPESAALEPGQIVDPVVCRISPDQSYALYLPSSYSPEKNWPILYGFDARQRGRLVVELFREQAEELGVIIASSNNSRSDEAVDPNPAAMRAIWEDTHARFRVDPKRIYATGFSGGARAAVLLATARSGEVAGVIGVGAGFPKGWTPSSATPFAFYGLAAEGDFNYGELLKLDRALAELGLAHSFDSFPGTHDWPPVARCGDALGWLETLAIRHGHAQPNDRHLEERLRAGRERARELAATGDPVSAARRYDSLVAELQGLRDVSAEIATLGQIRASASFRSEAELELRAEKERDLFVKTASAELALALRLPPEAWSVEQTRRRLGVPKLEKMAAGATSPATRRGARQSLEALFVQTAFYLPRDLSTSADHLGAARCLELAASLHPEQLGPWYRLAQERARSKDRRGTLDALRRAVAAGFADGAALESDVAFSAIRSDKAFREIVAQLAASNASRPGATPRDKRW